MHTRHFGPFTRETPMRQWKEQTEMQIRTSNSPYGYVYIYIYIYIYPYREHKFTLPVARYLCFDLIFFLDFFSTSIRIINKLDF